MGMTAAARQERKAARAARSREIQDRLLDVALSPNMIRLAMIAGIIAYSTHVTRSSHKESPIESALAFALPGIGIPLIAADAGIRDKYALAGISGAALAYTAGQAAIGLGEAYGGAAVDIVSGFEVPDWAKRLFPGGQLLELI